MQTEIIIIFVTSWFALCFFDLIFRTCMFFPYMQALEMSGIQVKPFYVKCYSTCFNRSFVRWSRYKPKFIRAWFALGAFVTSLIVIPAVVLLIISAARLMVVEEKHKMDALILQPVVPGINLPLSQIFHYILSLFLCSTFHELGHALAAAREGVPIEGSGIFIFGVLPAAFVDLHVEKLNHSSLWQQLKIFSAGVWHNLVLCMIAAVLLLSNTVILTPFFEQNNGVTVVDIAEGSGALGPAGLKNEDQIYSINGCPVDNLDTWKECLITVGSTLQNGFCVPDNLLGSSDSKEIVQKCDEEQCKSSASNLCFSFTDKELLNSACLQVRNVVQSGIKCETNSDCSENGMICCHPELNNTSERLIIIERNYKNAVLYLGSVSELYETVSVCGWVAKQEFISVGVIYMYETFLKYILSFSGALAALNVIPCPGLDGQWLCQTLVDWFFIVLIPKRSHRSNIVVFLKSFGFALLFLNIVIGAYQVFK